MSMFHRNDATSEDYIVAFFCETNICFEDSVSKKLRLSIRDVHIVDYQLEMCILSIINKKCAYCRLSIRDVHIVDYQ